MSEKSYAVRVDEQRCKGTDDCGICVYICPKDVFETSDRLTQRGVHPPEVVRVADCIGCENCMIYCPDLAVVVESHRTGRAAGSSAVKAGRAGVARKTGAAGNRR